MSVIRYLSDLWAFRARAAALSARIEEGCLTPAQQLRAVEALMAGEARLPVAAAPATGAMAA
ncbi:hypothetical protein [Paragemmobacter ruber]|uniref:Uncharacterized protein n=1 Tax=Paragemmobacter ruber TaxID=1985673 RepID=A0ABW9Y5N9_9RHOB|nr:hypothetical protein [Rhodobacter ruber]NBE07174.1 hypothetical protein [Rhodobacter ruber]